MSVRIITDSTCDVSAGVLPRLTVVPLTVHFGDREYIDGVTITKREFYEKLIESDEMPHTSQATPAAFEAVFAQVAEAGDTAVVLTISEKLSGTYQSAVIAAAEYPGIIHVVDTQNACIGSGILVELALRLADAGRSAEEIAEELTRERENVCLIALLDTLEYLKKGGRISRLAAFAGGILAIKPVVRIADGEIQILGKARGSKQGNNLLVNEIEKTGGVDFSRPVLLGYSGLNDDLLQKYIADSRPLWAESPEPLRITDISSVIGTHAGPGAIAAAFFHK
ncbi:MAG: DegV family protein [Oscillospiraceae bacterium]|nr:DegV family protein [Oscillospiraceae bacterium]